MIPSIASLTTGRDRAYFLRNPDRKVYVRPYVPGETTLPEEEPDDLELVVVVFSYAGSRLLKAPVWVEAMPPDDEATAFDLLWDWAVQQRLPGFDGDRP